MEILSPLCMCDVTTSAMRKSLGIQDAGLRDFEQPDDEPCPSMDQVRNIYKLLRLSQPAAALIENAATSYSGPDGYNYITDEFDPAYKQCVKWQGRLIYISLPYDYMGTNLFTGGYTALTLPAAGTKIKRYLGNGSISDEVEVHAEYGIQLSATNANFAGLFFEFAEGNTGTAQAVGTWFIASYNSQANAEPKWFNERVVQVISCGGSDNVNTRWPCLNVMGQLLTPWRKIGTFAEFNSGAWSGPYLDDGFTARYGDGYAHAKYRFSPLTLRVEFDGFIRKQTGWGTAGTKNLIYNMPLNVQPYHQELGAIAIMPGPNDKVNSPNNSYWQMARYNVFPRGNANAGIINIQGGPTWSPTTNCYIPLNSLSYNLS